MAKSKADIVIALHEGIVNIEFTKADGTNRQMAATLKADLLPAMEPSVVEKATSSSKGVTSLAVWDTEAEGWRSFRWNSLLTVNGEAFTNA